MVLLGRITQWKKLENRENTDFNEQINGHNLIWLKIRKPLLFL